MFVVRIRARMVAVVLAFLVLGVLGTMAIVWPQRWLFLFTSIALGRWMLLVVFVVLYLLTRGNRS